MSIPSPPPVSDCVTPISPKYCPCRYMFGLAALPGLAQLLRVIVLPNSPRWLVLKGRICWSVHTLPPPPVSDCVTPISPKYCPCRYMFGLAALPGLAQLLGVIVLPNSPRWLVSKGRNDQARATLRRLRGTEEVEKELSTITTAHTLEQEAARGKGRFYYPLEVSSIEYCCFRVFRKEYFRLITKLCK